MSSSRDRPPLPLLIGFGGFLAAIVYLIAVSMTPRDVPTFVPTARSAVARAALDAETEGMLARLDTITIDASDAEQWRYFRFSDGALLQPPDTLAWDLAVRRYHVRVAGPAADLGPADDDAAVAPTVRFQGEDGRDDSGHPTLRRWYRYGMLTHLLESKRHAYLVRTRDGGLARLEVLSYYCPGPRPGCMTFRYAYPLHGAGDSRTSRRP